MTRIGKCDICRQRKVKCDERHPRCGQCMKKNRPCRYEHGKISKFVDGRSKHGELGVPVPLNADSSDDSSEQDAAFLTRGLSESPFSSTPSVLSGEKTILSIRSVKSTKEGKGIFHTFSSIRLGDCADFAFAGVGTESTSSTVQMLHSPSASDGSLRARFIELLGNKPLEWNPSFLWGSWVTLIPQRIGRNQALDDSVACFISGSIAHRNMSQDNVARARKEYSQALLSLQNILTGSDEKLRLASETLAAVKLLIAFETFLGLWNNRWVSHSRGLTDLLVARGPNADEDDMNRSLFYSSLPLEFMEAVLNGSNSAFDSPEWLYFPPPEYSTECPAFTTAYKVIMQQMIRIPRLIRLVRELRRNLCNIELGMEAVALAEKLYKSNLDTLIDGAITKYAVWVPTRDPGLAIYYPESMEFTTVNVFETLTRYCYCRIVIIGLCRAIKEVFPFSPMLDAAPLEEEELRNASLVACSTQYAEGLWDPFPLGALLIILPLQVAFGTWWRVQREDRAMMEDMDRDARLQKEMERGKACFMKEFCRETSNNMLRVWKGEEMSTSRLEVQTASLEGGPLMNWMKRKIIPL